MKRTLYLGLIGVILAVVLVVAFLIPATPPQRGSESVGICVHSLSLQDAELVSASGARWIRIDCNSSQSHFGDYLKNAKQQNLSVLAILDSWMFNGSCQFTIDEWQSKVTYFVSQYSDYVDAWEIWNEPTSPTYPLLNLNLTNEQAPENMGTIVDFYYSMAETAYPIIRQHDPNATIVLFGGLNLYSGGDPNLALDMEFATQLAAKGIQQYGDAIAVHAYPWSNETNDVWNRYNDSLSIYQALFPNKAVWVTETGQKIQDGCTAQMQADYLVQALEFFDDKVDCVFWYALYDDEYGNFGLIENGVQRPAYTSMQKALNP